MIKGLTVVKPVGSAAAWERLSSLFGELGFEPGRGWDDGAGKGSAFLAPLGNVEFVTGRPPAVPELLVECTQIEIVHGVVKRWLAAEELGSRLSDVVETHWKSRMFTVDLSDANPSTSSVVDPTSQKRDVGHPLPGLVFGFWEREDVLAGVPIAVEGDLSAAGMRFGIVTARWNAVITDRLLQGSLDGILRSGGRREDIDIVRVPGAWEVPAAARMMADLRDTDGKRKYDAIITLGCLLRGETAHYEAIYNEAARGIGQSQQETGVPHAFGVLTCETLEQALNRAGVKAGNKGFEAAVAAIEMVSIARKIGHVAAGEHEGSGVAAGRAAQADVDRAVEGGN
ncbi:6,7-dimethyl-8-ribityllumazine synthase [Terriglobus roseus DSM 18391]|uniref:6,7-dimethyl-8-ribityllumazine synthase n=1 Tax=Terriglobus roseus (strain DSM 18391 / NRRL B-41598 / KBS 63) TaxID=926566 RepID=I3ZL45_TERRK|nr:6,7-dimethyl-8-ribityllumazine synthase [Terriglobus roseus]AFL89963.1 6,7-dimethyl-8-ribityllumazine synthase [Terriglobus roseus DSM 18391]